MLCKAVGPKTCIWPVCITVLIISIVSWCFCITWLIFKFVKVFFFLILLKPFYLTVGLVLIFPPVAMIKECADKYSITLRIEEGEIKYRTLTWHNLFFSCENRRCI